MKSIVFLEEAKAVNSKSGVTLQISLAPTDLPTAKHTVPHQLRVWADQVDEILLVLDKHRSHGRYSMDWQEQLSGAWSPCSRNAVPHIPTPVQ